MSVPISIVAVTASNEDGDYVEIKLEGLVVPPPDSDLEIVKTKVSELFEWAFGDEPDKVEVHDSMKHRAEREGEGEERGRLWFDDGDHYGVEEYDGRQFIIDVEDDSRRVYEVVNTRPGDTATAGVIVYRMNAGRDHGLPDNVKEVEVA